MQLQELLSSGGEAIPVSVMLTTRRQDKQKSHFHLLRK